MARRKSRLCRRESDLWEVVGLPPIPVLESSTPGRVVEDVAPHGVAFPSERRSAAGYRCPPRGGEGGTQGPGPLGDGVLGAVGAVEEVAARPFVRRGVYLLTVRAEVCGVDEVAPPGVNFPGEGRSAVECRSPQRRGERSAPCPEFTRGGVVEVVGSVLETVVSPFICHGIVPLQRSAASFRSLPWKGRKRSQGRRAHRRGRRGGCRRRRGSAAA